MADNNIVEILARMLANSTPPTEEEAARERVAEAEREARNLRVQRESRIALANIPRRHAETLDDLRETRALTVCRRWLEIPARDQSSLVLAGPYGTGKSIAAAWALSEIGGLFVRATDLARMSGFDEDLHHDLRRAILLVIDDLGAEYSDRHGWLASVVSAIIEYRLGDFSRTLITTNLRPHEIHERYGDRLVERLREAGHVVVVAGPSMRGTAPTPGASR